MDVRVEAERPGVDVGEGQSGDPQVEVQKDQNQNEQQEPQVEAEGQVQEQPKANGEAKDEQHEEQQPQTRPDLAGGEGQQPQVQPPQQPDEQPQDDSSAADDATTSTAARVAAGQCHGRPWFWFGILSFLLIAGATFVVCFVILQDTDITDQGLKNVTQENTATDVLDPVELNTSGLEQASEEKVVKLEQVSEEKVVKYRCDTVPTYDADDSSPCGGGSPPDSACFTLHKGANWQCSQEGQNSPTPCDQILLDGGKEFYKGACVFKGNDDYQDAMDASNLKLAVGRAKALDALEKTTREKKVEKKEEPGSRQNSQDTEEEKQGVPTDSQNSKGTEDEKYEEPTKIRASSLRNLKWRWAEHKLLGVGYVPRMGLGDSWNMPADRDALVKELEEKKQDPKAVAKQYETRPVEFADVEYPKRRRTFGDYKKALDWLALDLNIQGRDDL